MAAGWAHALELWAEEVCEATRTSSWLLLVSRWCGDGAGGREPFTLEGGCAAATSAALGPKRRGWPQGCPGSAGNDRRRWEEAEGVAKRGKGLARCALATAYLAGGVGPCSLLRQQLQLQQSTRRGWWHILLLRAARDVWVLKGRGQSCDSQGCVPLTRGVGVPQGARKAGVWCGCCGWYLYWREGSPPGWSMARDGLAPGPKVSKSGAERSGSPLYLRRMLQAGEEGGGHPHKKRPETYCSAAVRRGKLTWMWGRCGWR